MILFLFGYYVDENSIIGFPFAIADSEQDMPGFKPWPLGWPTGALTTELKEVGQKSLIPSNQFLAKNLTSINMYFCRTR